MDALISFGIVFALGHFYFSLGYDAKKYGLGQTAGLFLVSLLISFGWYEMLRDTSSLTSVSYFAVSVIFLFMLHNFYDLWRFHYRKAAVILFALGTIVTVPFYQTYPDHWSGIAAAVIIWAIVFSHYLFWIGISVKRFEKQESAKFIWYTLIVHLLLGAGFIVHLFMSISLLSVLYSLAFFYFMTLVHVVFSTLRQGIKYWALVRLDR